MALYQDRVGAGTSARVAAGGRVDGIGGWVGIRSDSESGGDPGPVATPASCASAISLWYVSPLGQSTRIPNLTIQGKPTPSQTERPDRRTDLIHKKN